jgi:outer membrane beta-barrel protein
MTRRSRIPLLVVVGLLLPRAALAEETQAGELYSIEKRDLLGTHELSASLGALPIDAFAKGLTLRGSYSYHFTHLFGWEIIGGLYSFNFDSGLKQKLRDTYEVQPTEMGELSWILDSNVIVRPLYGKITALNNKILTGELFFNLGYALGGYTAAYPSGMSLGMGIRVFLSKYFSVRFDIRDYLFIPSGASVQNQLYLSLGVSLTFGFSDETVEE